MWRKKNSTEARVKAVDLVGDLYVAYMGDGGGYRGGEKWMDSAWTLEVPLIAPNGFGVS